jgi:hypothetical protein
VELRDRMPAPDGDGEFGRRLKKPCAAARREVSTGTN